MMYQHTTKNKKNKENPAKHEDKTIIPTHLSLAMETLTSNFPESYLLLFLFLFHVFSLVIVSNTAMAVQNQIYSYKIK